MKKIILVAGYAFSGKSTLEAELKRLNIPTTSSSIVLSVNTLNYLHIPVTEENMDVLTMKQEETFQSLIKTYAPESRFTDFKSCREAKVFVAEKCIVPAYGRRYFADKLLHLASSCESDLCVLFTTIKEEYSILINLLNHHGLSYKLVNIRRATEDSSVDARQLFSHPDALTLWNDFNEPEELSDAFFELIKR